MPVDAMTAVIRGLYGMLESVRMNLAIVVDSTNATSPNSNNTSIADGEFGSDSESDEPELSIMSFTTTLEGDSCPTSLFDEGEELALVMSDAINKAALKALAKHVPGESPLTVTCSAPLHPSRS